MTSNIAMKGKDGGMREKGAMAYFIVVFQNLSSWAENVCSC
jgi:hypothetical protein